MSRSVGFRVFSDFKRPDPELVKGFAGIPTSNINDMMNRLYNTNGSIRPYNRVPLLGTAFTVKAPLGDNLMFHLALDLAQAGDVIVVDGGGCTDRSLCGEIMMRFAKNRGIKGFVIDGAIRDLDGVETLEDFSVYAKAVTPQGPYKHGPGEIGCPVVCGGVVVFPGDIIVGDPDGIVVVRPDDAPEILELAKSKLAGEDKTLDKLRKGGLLDNHAETYGAEAKKMGLKFF